MSLKHCSNCAAAPLAQKMLIERKKCDALLPVTAGVIETLETVISGDKE